jgi:NHL repeat
MSKHFFLGASAVVLIMLAALLLGCGSDSAIVPTRFLIVADFDNNRVLIYDTPPSTAESASVVLGQADFTTATADIAAAIPAGAAGTVGAGPTASTMSGPAATAVDSAGNLYVAENGNCRVTQFQPPFTTGMSASLVFGQPDLTTGNCAAATSASSLGNASGVDQVFGVAVDRSGNLWVADSGSNRVLEYKPPFSNGMAATLAIGQANLTTGSPNQGGATPTSATLSDLAYPVFDSSGNLWVADFFNNRLLQFKPPFATGMAASVVLGQADFTHGLANQGGTVAANTLDGGNGATFDRSGNMWVPDAFNHRVLEFTPPFTSNMQASLVLGQADFVHGSANQGGATPTSATLNFPHQVAFDSNGNLFVTDAGNNRTLVFTPPFSNGMNASMVLGQADFVSTTAATTATSQVFPTGVITAPQALRFF